GVGQSCDCQRPTGRLRDQKLPGSIVERCPIPAKIVNSCGDPSEQIYLASLPSPSILGALADYSCDHQFRCGCRGPWRNLFEGDELSSTQKQCCCILGNQTD